MMKKHLFSAILILASFYALPQTMEVGGYGGIAYYLGDLNPGIHFLTPKPAYGVIARYNIDSRWTIKANAYRGKVQGDDSRGRKNELRGLSFESRITDISVTGEFNFFDYFTGARKNTLTPFIFGGIGMVIFNPMAGGVKLKSIGTEGQNVGFDGRKPYSLAAFTIPFGFGFKYSLNKRFCVTAEWGLRKTYTDYIDDVSKTYYLDGTQIDPANPEQYLSDPTGVHQPYQERGNEATDDWYSFSGITLTYKFRLYNKNKCPDQWMSE